MSPSPTTLELWKSLGLAFSYLPNATFLYGVRQQATDAHRAILSTIGQDSPPLDWCYRFEKLYRKQSGVLWVKDPEGSRAFLPQVVIISPLMNTDEASITVRLAVPDFRPRFKTAEALQFYEHNADGSTKKILFDGKNARLTRWDADIEELVFQGCSYFDYLQTNMALDAKQGSLETLREQSVKAGHLEPLAESELANSTGINGLLFSNDGYMIIQKRRDNVLVRPRELCSGFSGTIDKKDIVHAVKAGGHLLDVDTIREAVEELGIDDDEVVSRRFLGLTRELTRGGAPEMFYAIDVDLPEKTIRTRIPKDKEGDSKVVFFGRYAFTALGKLESESLPKHFWSLVQNIASRADGPISIPLLTNLVLWFQLACSGQVGAASIPKMSVEAVLAEKGMVIEPGESRDELAGVSLSAIRDLLLAAFTAAELRRLVQYTSHAELRRVANEFGPNDSLATLVDTVLACCEKRELWAVLLKEVEDNNPTQYARFALRIRGQ